MAFLNVNPFIDYAGAIDEGLATGMKVAEYNRVRRESATAKRDEKAALEGYGAELKKLGAAATPEQKRDVYFRASVDPRVPQALRQTYAGFALQRDGKSSPDYGAFGKLITGEADKTDGDATATATETVETKANGDVKTTKTKIDNGKWGQTGIAPVDWVANDLQESPTINSAIEAVTPAVNWVKDDLSGGIKNVWWNQTLDEGLARAGNAIVEAFTGNRGADQATINKINESARQRGAQRNATPAEIDAAIIKSQSTAQPAGVDPLTAVLNVLVPTAAAADTVQSATDPATQAIPEWLRGSMNSLVELGAVQNDFKLHDFTSGTPINMDDVNHMRSLRGAPPLNPPPSPGLVTPSQLPLSTVPGVPDNPVARTQAAIDYYGDGRPAFQPIGGNQGAPLVARDVPAPPVREAVGYRQNVPLSDRRSVTTDVVRPPAAITSPLPVEPDVVGVPLDSPVARTQAAFDFYGDGRDVNLPAIGDPTQGPPLVRRDPNFPAIGDPTQGPPLVPRANTVGLTTQQTPQQREIIQRDLDNPPSSRIQRFRQLNNLPQLPPEESTRLDNFINTLNQGAEGFADIVGAPATVPPTAGEFRAAREAASVEPTGGFVEGFAEGRQAVSPVPAAPVPTNAIVPPSQSFATGLQGGAGYTNPGVLNTLFNGVTSDMSIEGMIETAQANAGLTGKDIDGEFGPTTVGALRDTGMTDEDINTLQRDMVRERILASGRYQYIGDTLTDAIGYYNKDNPNNPISSDTVFSPEIQDGILDSHIRAISPAAKNASSGEYAAANADAQDRASFEIMNKMAHVWAGLPDPDPESPTYRKSTFGKGRNRANITLDTFKTAVDNFVQSGDMTALRNALGAAESDSLGGYNAANQPDIYIINESGKPVVTRGQYEGEAGGNVSSLTIGQLMSKLNNSNQITSS